MVNLLLFCALGGSCTHAQDFDSHLRAITKPHLFSIIAWETGALCQEAHKAVWNIPRKTSDDVTTVVEYFAYVARLRSLRSEIQAVSDDTRQGTIASLEAEANKLQQKVNSLADTVEKILEEQVREVLSQQGIFNPMYKYTKLKIGFPPLNFRLEQPPRLLVVSPRDRIESMREITLRQNISLEEIETIEAEVDKLGVSSLVVELGGFAGTYPSFVTRDAGLCFTIDTVAEEWLHQYLAFKPLGFRYVLDLTGICRNYEIAIINETVAGMVSKEIGSLLYNNYYTRNENGETKTETTWSGFDFNREMREIRRAVDRYLAEGQIEQAEAFMEEKRQYLSANGYYLRKLNQAYFAFHGTYADRPTSISPIGVELKQLRSQSASLKDFLETAGTMTSRQDLQEGLK